MCKSSEQGLSSGMRSGKSSRMDECEDGSGEETKLGAAVSAQSVRQRVM